MGESPYIDNVFVMPKSHLGTTIDYFFILV
jgi:hypothetical protein